MGEEYLSWHWGDRSLGDGVRGWGLSLLNPRQLWRLGDHSQPDSQQRQPQCTKHEEEAPPAQGGQQQR